MTRGLGFALARMGWSLGTRGPWAWLRGATLTLGTALLLIAMAAMVTAQSAAQLRQTRADSLVPVTASSSDHSDLLYEFKGFTQVDDHPVTVIAIEPLAADAPLPPGVRSWPGPGEAIVSPALRDSLRASDPRLFGQVVGTIEPDGLEVPRERRVYLRPATDVLDTARMQSVIGFGGTPEVGSGYGEGYLYAAAGWSVQLLLVGGLLVPALVCLSLGAGLDGESRQLRSRLLAVLGAGRRHLAVIDASEAALPVGVGTLIGATCVMVACWIDLPIPALDALLPARDTRAGWPGLLSSGLLAPLISVAVILAVRQGRRGLAGRSLQNPRQDRQMARATIGLFVGATMIWFTAQSTDGVTRTIAYVVGAAVVATMLPALVGVVLSFAGAALAHRGMSHGSPSAIAGGRRLQRYPVRTTRLALGVCFAVLAMGQVQLWSSQLGSQYFAALAERSQSGTIVVAARSDNYGTGVQKFVQKLPDGADAAWVTLTAPSDPAEPVTITVDAPCKAVVAFGFACDEPTITVQPTEGTELFRQVARYTTGGAIDLHVGAPVNMSALETAGSQLLVVSTSGEDLVLPELQRQAYATVSGGLQLTTIGQGWVTSGTVSMMHAGWTVLIGLVGLAALILATGFAMAGDVISSARDIAPLTTLTGRGRWIYGLTVWRTALPLAVAGAVGAGAYFVLPSGLTTATGLITGGSYMSPSPVFALGSVALTAVFGVLVAVIAAASVRRKGATWRPGTI